MKYRENQRRRQLPGPAPRRLTAWPAPAEHPGVSSPPATSKRAHSLALRAVISLVLMVGFYVLALAMALGVLWLPYAEWRYANRVDGRLVGFSLVGAFLILQSIVPRRDTFVAPGPRLSEEQQPKLFEQLRGVAASAEQEMPSEVYLVADVNAWVSQRGGLMGLGARRIMGVGLPLLQAVSVPQLRAILAHEFGHYFGGDVKLGPLVYRTREALVRTVVTLHEHSTLLKKPFEWYAALFFRVTHGVSRHQELQADALAARVAGASALASGLRKVHGAALAFEPYWAQEVTPVLEAGYRPPLAAGFSRFLDQPDITGKVQEAVEADAREGKADPYDTHPSLRDRLQALGSPEASDAPDALPAIALLDGVPELERELLAPAAASREGGLAPLEWEQVGPAVYVPQWERILKECGAALAGLDAASLATADWPALGRAAARALDGSAPADPSGDERFAQYLVGAAVGLSLVRRGFEIDAPPGAPLVLARDGMRVDVFELRARLAADPDGWRAFCAEVGLEGPLGRPSCGSRPGT